MIFLIFGSLLAPFGSLLAPFGSLLAPFECQTSSKILFLFDLVSPFADVRNHFCKKVNVGTLSARTRIVGTPICGNPSLRPRAELCRRHLDKLFIIHPHKSEAPRFFKGSAELPKGSQLQQLQERMRYAHFTAA